MKTKKRIKAYHIVRAPSGKWTCQSNVYDRAFKTVYAVAAVSLKQALYLAYQNQTYNGIVGVLDRSNDPAYGFIDYQNNHHHGLSYWEHGKAVRPL